MRVVGLLGILAVVFGLVVVFLKIRWRRDFRWLVRRQTWIAASLVWLYSVLPIDRLIHRYNVAQIQSGNQAPIVQLTAHAVSAECLPVLIPLCQWATAEVEVEVEVDSGQANHLISPLLIRDGLRAYLRKRQAELRAEQRRAETGHWSQTQWFRDRVIGKLEEPGVAWQQKGSNGTHESSWKALQQEAFDRYW